MQNPVKGSGSIRTALHLLHSITQHGPSLNSPESATLHHLTSQIEALEEENRELRKSAQAFGDLAERLSEQLRNETASRARRRIS